MQAARLAWARGCSAGAASVSPDRPQRRPRVLQQRGSRLLVAAEAEEAGCGDVSTCPKCGGGGNGASAANRASSSGSAVTVQRANVAECDAPCAKPGRTRLQWPQKSELYLLRSDGHSCSRETVQPSGNLQFVHPSSQQQLLVWKTRPKRVMVLKKLGDELMEEYVDVLRYLGEELGLRVVVEPHDFAVLDGLCMSWVDTYALDDLAQLHSYIDFVVCLGGDGLLLHAASLFGSALPPIISFKLGSLGFLTTHSYADFRRHLHNVVNGCRELESCQLISAEDGRSLLGVYITLRMRLECEVWRDGEALPGERFEVLNEVVLSRGHNPYLSKIEVYERDQLITKVQADGVMLATPTGSTAYNVAAGGSMVHPSVPAILFTPVCPHSLNFRPIILPDYVEIEMRIAPDSRCSAVVTFDGRDTRELRQGDSVRVRMSPNPVPTINNADMTTDWISSIQRCFQWSERVEQKGMHPQHTAHLHPGLAEGTLMSVGSMLSSMDFTE